MQNENAPRRNLSAQPLQRGSQQAGRLGRAKQKVGTSFCGLLKRNLVFGGPGINVSTVNCLNRKT
ncbi:hypothetical protein QE408_000682 [Agrobacterium larrymoorei]|uniref:Uncharacterized protein n=1 Tax=Agrobacterium larrymoorei TaxID=160699 RepID=A0ABU0UF46_9HYPH|nr:hypothetical protein [Agrobacterium larrymoorei]